MARPLLAGSYKYMARLLLGRPGLLANKLCDLHGLLGWPVGKSLKSQRWLAPRLRRARQRTGHSSPS